MTRLVSCLAWMLAAGTGCGTWHGVRTPDELRAELAPRLHSLTADQLVVPHQVDADAVEELSLNVVDRW